MAGGQVESQAATENSVSALDTAQAARTEASDALGAANAELNDAQAALVELERRVDAGDGTISALAVVEGRAKIELAGRRITSLVESAKSAEQQLADAKTNRIVDDWEIRAPQLRAQILRDAQQVADSQDQLFRSVDEHNAAVIAVRHELGHAKSHRVQLERGLHIVGRESARSILFDAVLAACNPFMRRSFSQFNPTLNGLPEDCVPVIAPDPMSTLRRTGWEDPRSARTEQPIATRPTVRGLQTLPGLNRKQET